ncbi:MULTISPECIES: threonine/serine dehydratase [Halocynthiibacter]|uniref:Pyridoxal-phosphate dependent enzyme n=1 Tax=Halocynthiibacter halioticoli TaxID=2986804 RepID=A0AAE3IWI4_9RHOB|nr:MULTISPECIES: pyridoxal-phosphate dependent enzyme [Halocynthiibacter]MCV6823383.1 pyridoxal-phosphate dependent enzyme [Halocynthiibacter halioticoli]MCW4056384.1 pyridoxal-phosphate dependent enzyme [Halocynthiibacter sp. SDUM655004]
MPNAPTLDEIKAASEILAGQIIRTPVVRLSHDRIPALPNGAKVSTKLELFQETGTFKARGVLLAIMAASSKEKEAGFVAVSGGNHALAVAYGAKKFGIRARVIMPKATDPARIEGCRSLGAEVELAEDIATGVARMEELAAKGATALHPFESPYMTLGAATCGLEIMQDITELDAVVVPVGGGGLISGISRAVKLINPSCEVIGVEPFGADTMTRSFAEGTPQAIEKVQTIADSLGAPSAQSYSFSLAKDHVDQMICVDDQALINAMGLLYDGLKIVAEPACAATTAAATGPLHEHLAGKNVALVACGSNIGPARFHELLSQRSV